MYGQQRPQTTSASMARGYSASPETDDTPHRGRAYDMMAGYRQGPTNNYPQQQMQEQQKQQQQQSRNANGYQLMEATRDGSLQHQQLVQLQQQQAMLAQQQHQYLQAQQQSAGRPQQQQKQQSLPPGASALRYGPPYTPEFVDYSNTLASVNRDRGFANATPAGGGSNSASQRGPGPQVQFTTPSRVEEGQRQQQQHSIGVGGDSPLYDNSGRHNNAGPSAHNTSSANQPSDAQLRAAEQAKVRWAFSVDRTARVHQPLMTALTSSNIREDLVGVVRLLSSVTNEVQTTLEPSYISSMAGVNAARKGRGSDDDGSFVGGGGDGGEDGLEEGRGGFQSENLRSIGVQSGLGLNRSNTATQVVEGDIASTAPTAQLDYDKIVAMQQEFEDDQQRGSIGGGFAADGMFRYEDRAGRKIAVNPSAYVPFSSLSIEEYPIYLAEARRVGVANRYGFVSLPRPPVELPPRRKVRAVQPVHYTHLHGKHELGLDEVCTSQLTRAYSLWIQGTGFVPKY